MMEKKPKKSKSQRGFMLIDLLVAMSIISLLASILLVSVNKTRVKARDKRRAEDLSQITKALELYYSDNGHYPCFGGVGGDGLSGWTFISADAAAHEDMEDAYACWTQAMGQYIGPVQDPQPADIGSLYLYGTNINGQDYAIVSVEPEDMRNYPDSMRMASLCGLPYDSKGQCVNPGTSGHYGQVVGFWTPGAVNWWF